MAWTRGVRGLFVAGTDTDVGKTVVAAGLLALLRSHGVDAVPMKPVQTGCRRRKGATVAPDLEWALRAAGLQPEPSEREWMAPYRFLPACSPHLAARMAGQRISIPRLAAAHRRLAARHAFTVVESAGGILAPLSPRESNLDLVLALDLPVVLVARAGLGTLNHTLLSVRELRRAGRPPVALVLNNADAGTPAWIRRDNEHTLRRLTAIPILGVLPFRRDLDSLSDRPAAFVRWIRKSLRRAPWTVLVPKRTLKSGQAGSVGGKILALPRSGRRKRRRHSSRPSSPAP